MAVVCISCGERRDGVGSKGSVQRLLCVHAPLKIYVAVVLKSALCSYVTIEFLKFVVVLILILLLADASIPMKY